MTTLFIADIHLGNEHPQISQRFCDFLRGEARSAEALYILGDLFEVWIGDDGVQPEHEAAIAALRELTSSGVPVYVMHGNRDFLLGAQFEVLSGCRLIDDHVVINLYGTPTLLMHGDTLCTDDNEYLQFRQQMRSSEWQQQFLGQSVEQRVAIARHYREESRRRSQGKPLEIMDVNNDAVIDIMERYGVARLIHGHTHRPALHALVVDYHPAQRIVVGDWYEQQSVLRCDVGGCRLSNLD
jgi:UDP-2,3-diacylglucosamine hydrolase